MMASNHGVLRLSKMCGLGSWRLVVVAMASCGGRDVWWWWGELFSSRVPSTNKLVRLI